MRSRSTVRKNVAPPTDDGLIPAVLTVAAVRTGWMPALGKSALSPALEAAVSSQFRYWLADNETNARAVRDALVESGELGAASLMKVDDETRRVIRESRTFLVEVVHSDVPLEKSRTHVEVAALASADAECDVFTNFDTGIDIVKDVAEKMAAKKSWSAAYKLNDANRAAVTTIKDVTAFVMATRPDVLFVTSNPSMTFLASPHIEVLPQITAAPSAVSEAMQKATSREIKLVKADATEAVVDERFVLGIVLEPDVVDSQKDTYDAHAIRKAAHFFMENYRAVGLQHKDVVTGKVVILESYVAPSDITVGETVIKAGTWLMGMRAKDDAIWNGIKSGAITGLSIGGTAFREPLSE